MLHVPRSANVKEWTFTLPKELPLWELESQWTLECLKRDCRGQTLMDWGIFYIIRKLLKCRCLRWLASPIWTYETQVMAKRKATSQIAPIVKLVIWLPTTKSQESTRFTCVQVVCDISLESSWQGLQLFFGLHLNRRSACEVMGPQVAGVPTLAISGQIAIWMWALWKGTKYIIRGKAVASLEFGLCWVLWVWIARGSF